MKFINAPNGRIFLRIYDVYKESFRFVITGSARLETFRRSGDSLVGRYFHTHLFPLNLGDFHKKDFFLPKNPEELLSQAADQKDPNVLEDLLVLGGFPEPYFSGSESFWKRWSSNHQELILTEDMRDLTRIQEIDKVAALLEMLKPAAGHLVSYRNLGLDLEATHGSVRRWLETFHKIQLLFPVPPYWRNIRRSYKVEKKWYFMDWRQAPENIFENYVAASLLRMATLYSDRFGEKFSLFFVRTHDGAEVDFLVCREGKPWLLVEAKTGNPEVTGAVYRFSLELGVPCLIATRRKGIFKKMTGKEGQKIFCISWGKVGPLLP